jgi:hypothetical protein
LSSFVTTLIALASMVAGVLLGSLLRRRLPDAHLRDDSKDVVKTATGMIATLVALVIGLLVSSAKSSFDQANAGITEMGARIIMLDRLLGRYGAEAAPIRGRLREAVAAGVDRIWPTTSGPKGGLAAVEKATGLEDVQEAIRRLTPRDEASRSIQAQALDSCKDLAASRWLMIEQAQGEPPTVFLVMLVFWLTVLFTGLGLLAPGNATTRFSLTICAVSMAGAIFLILEMNRPLDGTIRVSPAPLHKSLSVINSKG